MPRFDPEAILKLLAKHEVRYVLIGGLAATLHGSPLRTGDADICPATTPENLERLAAALREMLARIRTADAPEGVPFACDAAFLQNVDLLNLTTRFGDLDLAYRPAGTSGFEDLEKSVRTFDLEGVLVPAASLEDIIRSKEAAGRPKDQSALPTLRALLRARRERD